MGNRKNQHPTGLAVLDERWAPECLRANDGATGNSSYTQASPRPGSMVPSDPLTRQAVGIAGGQTQGVELRVQRGGPVGLGGQLALYRPSTSTADGDYRGWSPTMPGPYRILEHETAAASNGVYVDVIPSTQTPLALHCSAAGETVRLHRYNDLTTQWDEFDTSVSDGYDIIGTASFLLVMPETERLLVAEWGGTDVTVNSSDDQGATWRKYARFEIDLATNVYTRAAANGDEILVFGADNAGRMQQWASNTLLTSAIRIFDATTFGDQPSAFPIKGGGFGVAYIRDSDSFPVFTRIGNAYEDISTSTTTVISSAAAGHLAVTIDPNGSIYAVVRDFPGSACRVWLSQDYGDTWTELETGFYQANTVAFGPGQEWHLASCRGGFLWGFRHAAASTLDDSVAVWFLGGWSTVTFRDRAVGGTGKQATQVGFARAAQAPENQNWLGFDLPSSHPGWVAVGTVAGTLVSPGAMDITTTANNGYYENEFTAPNGVNDQILFFSEVEVLSGGSVTSDDIVLQTRWANGASTQGATLRMSSTQIRVLDAVAATTLATVAVDLTVPTQLLVALRGGSAAVIEGDGEDLMCFYRQGTDTEWTELHSGSLTGGGAGPATCRIQIGHIANSTSQSQWYQAHYCSADDAGLADQAIAHESLQAKLGSEITPGGFPLPGIGDETAGASPGTAFMVAGSGPGTVDEFFTVEPDADFSIKNLFPGISPSPYQPWRSTQTAVNEDIVIDLVYDTKLDGTGYTVVVAIENTNLKEIQVGAWDGATFTSLGDVEMSTGFEGLSYTLTGDVLRPDTATTADAGRFVQHGEFVGGYAVLDPTGTPKVRRILYNSSGIWTQNATLRPTFRLEGVDTSEAASGTCELRAPRGLFVIHLPDATAALVDRLRLRITAANNDVAESYFQIGSAFVGGLVGFGKRWSRGWSRAMIPNTSRRTSTWGTTRVREEGPPRRRWIMSWPDAVDLSKSLRDTSPSDADFVGPSGGEPLAVDQDVWTQLYGLFELSKSGELPVVALGRVPNADATTNDRTLYLYGTLDGTVQASNVLGDEGAGEVFRIESITIDELK